MLLFAGEGLFFFTRSGCWLWYWHSRAILCHRICSESVELVAQRGVEVPTLGRMIDVVDAGKALLGSRLVSDGSVGT